MRENVRNVSRGRAGRERWEFALDNRQIAAVAVGALVIVGSSFVLGMNTGKSLAHQAKPAPVANSLDAFDAAHENLPTPPEPKHWEYEKLGGSKAPDAAPSAAATAQARMPPPARPLAPRAGSETATTPSHESPPVVSVTGEPAPQAVATGAASAAAAAAVPPAAAPEPAKTSAPPPTAPVPAKVVAKASSTSKAAPGPAAPSAMDKAIAAVSGHAKPASPAKQVASARPAPAPKEPSATAKTSTAGGFVIQVGASPNRGEADRIAKKFASRGARVVAADVDGKRWYRVRLASMTYPERSEAERALARLSRETGAHGFVTAAR